MSFYFTEEQVIEAARKVFRDYSTWSHGEFASQIEHGATLETWTNAHEEAATLAEMLRIDLQAGDDSGGSGRAIGSPPAISTTERS